MYKLTNKLYISAIAFCASMSVARGYNSVKVSTKFTILFSVVGLSCILPNWSNCLESEL